MIFNRICVLATLVLGALFLGGCSGDDNAAELEKLKTPPPSNNPDIPPPPQEDMGMDGPPRKKVGGGGP